MAVTDQLNRVQFISEDFETYRSEADSFFQTNYPQDFNNLINTDLGNALMDQLAFAMQALTFTVNRRASELFFATARLDSSVVKIARMLGYPIAPAFPGSSDLTIVFPRAPYIFPVPIPTGFQWQGPGTTIYEYVGATTAVLAPGQTSMTIPIKEGQTKTISFVSDGSTNQIFSVFGIPSDQFMYSDGLVVTVDGVAWTNLPLLKFQSTNTYEVLFTDAPPKLNFGDGIVGNIPNTNASIVMIYRFGQGLSGTIGLNQISAPVVPLVIAGNTIEMVLTNTVGDSGGDPEDIRHVQTFASSFFRTQNAAVIKSDYDTIAQLRPGVALADAQIIRGIDQDITIQSSLSGIEAGEDLIEIAVSGIQAAGVSGIPGLFVGGQNALGVSGTQFLGWNGSSVTGIGLLGVSGEASLFVSGVSGLGVSGISTIEATAVSGIELINDSVSGLTAYLSQAFSDTSQANQVQVIVLGVDGNNRYVAPSSSMLTDVQSTLQSLCDAVVTVVAVDGSSRIVNADVLIELGISQTAVQTDCENAAMQALTQTDPSIGLGLMVKRKAGLSLYRSQIQDAIEAAENPGDVIFMNITILNPSALLDADGNLIVSKQQLIQNGTVSVVTVKRFTANG